MDEGMELALGFHAGNNLIIALMVTSDWTVFSNKFNFLNTLVNPMQFICLYFQLQLFILY